MDLDYGPNRFGPTPYGANILGSTNSAQVRRHATGPGEVPRRHRGAPDRPGPVCARQRDPRPDAVDDHGRGGHDAARPASSRGPGDAPGARLPPGRHDPDAAAFGTVPNIGFNSAFAYDFNPRDGISAGQTDFEARRRPRDRPRARLHVRHRHRDRRPTRTSRSGTSTASAPRRSRRASPTPTARAGRSRRACSTPGPTTAAGAPGNHVMFVGDNEYELSTARGDRTGGDGQQASHWRADEISGRYIGIMDPTLAAGDREEITAADVRALELFGYSVDRTPSTASAQVAIAGNAGQHRLPDAGRPRGAPVGGGSLAVEHHQHRRAGRARPTTPRSWWTRCRRSGGLRPTVTLSPADRLRSRPARTAALAARPSRAASGGAVVYGRLVARLERRRARLRRRPVPDLGRHARARRRHRPGDGAAPSGQLADVTLGHPNTGDAPLTYLRILEPAASDPAHGAAAVRGRRGRAGGGPRAAEPASELPTGGDAPAARAARAAQHHRPGRR